MTEEPLAVLGMAVVQRSLALRDLTEQWVDGPAIRLELEILPAGDDTSHVVFLFFDEAHADALGLRYDRNPPLTNETEKEDDNDESE